MASELMTMNKEDLANALQRTRSYITNLKKSAAAPLNQGACTLAGWGGGISSGVIRAFIPEVFGLPVDLGLGIATSLIALTGAGDKLVDAVAVFGVGLAAPGFSRGTEGLIRGWMAEKK
jgi:hypothetical protein